MNKNLKQEVAVQLINCLYQQMTYFPNFFFENLMLEDAYQKYLSDFSVCSKSINISIQKKITINTTFPFIVDEIGQSFFENTAHILCGGEKKEFTTRKNNNLKVEQTQRNNIATIITDLSNGNQKPSLVNENNAIFTIPTPSNLVEGTDFTADVFFQNDTEVVCVEIKTVKPNKGVFKVEKQKILEAKAALKLRYPQKEIKYFLAFPFDPLSDIPCDYDKKRFMDYSVGFTKFFDEAEILLSGELWDYLSGNQQTMQEILAIINNIATPNFIDELTFLTEPKNRIEHKKDYLQLLQKWFLFQEYDLINQDEQIKQKITTKNLANIYNQSCFKDGEYKLQRVQELLKLAKIS